MKKSMITLRVLFLLLCTFFLPVCVSASPEAELKVLLSQIDSLQGNFKQQITTEKGKVIQESEGKMWLKKPARFRWEVLGKDKRIVVADGKQIWDYDIELEQVTVQPLTKSQSTTPIFFLTGDIDSLSKDFTIAAFKPQADHFKNSDQTFELKPKGSQAAFQWIRIGFKNKVLNELEVLDHLGQVSCFSFEKLQQNSEIDLKRFQFKAPKGVDVVGL